MYFYQVPANGADSNTVTEISVKFLSSCLTTAKNVIIVCTITKARKKRSMLNTLTERNIRWLEDILRKMQQKVALEPGG